VIVNPARLLTEDRTDARILSIMITQITAVAGRRGLILGLVAVVATAASAALKFAGSGEISIFVATAVALASLASVVGEATEQLGTRLGPGATGVVQSALGNLPELFISIFALRAGLVVVVQTALIGSILANSLLVLGIAFLVGGLRNGPQHFGAATCRMTAMLLVLSVASLAIPTLATAPGAPDFGHARDVSVITALVLLAVFAGSVPMAIKGSIGPSREHKAGVAGWPLGACIIVLTVAGVGAAFVSDWFVEALRPAMSILGLSEEFVGLVIVAIAGNAVENVVGITAAARNEPDLAVSLILNSSLQVALFLIPVLVLISTLLGGAVLTLVAPSLLIAALGLAAVLGALIIFDGESNYVEGLALIGLYVIIAVSVWFGPPVAR
jgi:Ca2+:H+ antiporter